MSSLIPGEATGGGAAPLQGHCWRVGQHPDRRAMVPGLAREFWPAGSADAGTQGSGRVGDQATIHRWVMQSTPRLAAAFPRPKPPVGQVVSQRNVQASVFTGSRIFYKNFVEIVDRTF